ncbi:hypothetical protein CAUPRSCDRAFT_12340 [Caulochytrium protostelioides]|nr:hypothetical protein CAUPRSCDRAFT_12340 [Caulochytrium protostelioides]
MAAGHLRTLETERLEARRAEAQLRETCADIKQTARSRFAALEKKVAELKAVVGLRNERIAQLQEQLQERDAELKELAEIDEANGMRMEELAQGITQLLHTKARPRRPSRGRRLTAASLAQ